jgi:iron complex outermembrane receptor protein
MNFNPKLSYAIAAILSGSSMGLGAATAHAAATANASDSEEIQEITVTAQRRSESIQNVPITIQAISGDTLQQLNVQTFDDLIKYTPNVTYSGNNPGGGNIYVRGLSSGGTSAGQSQSTTAPFPNVGLYLDDQSMQFPARNNDVYLVDMERVEVLEGPQGTLFGGGAQAGAIRYITNKPKLNVTEGNVNASYGTTAGGDPNSAVNGTVNLPLITDTLAVRATIFTDHHGGYISNVPGTIQLPPALCPAGATCPAASNGPLVGSNQNTLNYQGFRLSALYQINPDWSLLIQQNYQNMQADGYWSEYPLSTSGTPLARNQVDTFNPAFNNDRYESTAWTLSGKLGDLGRLGDIKAVYTGSYMSRHIEQQSDYSNYLVSGAGSYYDCTGKGAGYFKTAKSPTCYAPVGRWHDQVYNTHQSHELRFSTSEDNRLRALVGGFWEDFAIHDNMNFNYLNIPQCDAANLAISAAGGPDCVTAVGPRPGTVASDPSLRVNSNTAFGEDAKRGYRQAAAFTSIDFDIIPKVLTLTGGTRYFHYDEFEEGSEYYTETSPGVINVPNGACIAAGGCGIPINLKKSEHGFRSRGNLTWHITPDIMAYYTYSQGFRPGGFNRTNTLPDGTTVQSKEAPYIKGDKSTDQYLKPVGFNSDNLINNEIGLKTEFLDHRVQVDVSAYQMNWSDIQITMFDPVHLGNTIFVVNGPTYRVRGAELQFIARVTEGLTVQGSSSWNSSAQTNAPCLPSTRPTALGNPTPLGQCITQINSAPYTNPFGVLGTAPAYSPPLQFNLRARYDMSLGDYKPFASVGANHVAAMRNEPASFPDGNSPTENPPTSTLDRYTMPGYTTYDAAIGVVKDSWTAQITGNNLSNSGASVNTNSIMFIKSEVPLRPRVLTLTLTYRF